VIAVKQVVEFKVKIERVVTQAFKGNEVLKNAVKDGFDTFLNSDMKPDESARQLALFIHKVFQKPNPASKHSQLNQSIKEAPFDTLLSLFRHLLSKDVFESSYTLYLSERLLKRKSDSRDRELSFLSLIKAECGAQFMSRVEQMYSDIDTSHE